MLVWYVMHAEETQLQLRRDLMLWYVAAMTREPKTQRLTLPPTGPLLFEREFEILSDEGFRQRYRVIQEHFTELLVLCEATPHWGNVRSRRAEGSHIPASLWLAMVLDQLGRGLSSRAVCHRHCVNEGLYSQKRRHVLRSIVAALTSAGSSRTRIG